VRKYLANISKLLSQNGVESGPFDLATLSAVSKLEMETSLKTKEIILSVNEVKYGLSAPVFNCETPNQSQSKS